ncbi:MAG: hypothetical protein SFZ02_07825 [bacterium]|nr:hypothetical protein [bacterium]
MDSAQKARISDIQARYSPDLLQKAHVIGTAIGYRQQNNTTTEELVLVVLVDQKVPLESLPPQDQIPTEIEGVRTDVQSMGGTFKAG